MALNICIAYVLLLCSSYKVLDPNNYSSLYSIGDKDIQDTKKSLPHTNRSQFTGGCSEICYAPGSSLFYTQPTSPSQMTHRDAMSRRRAMHPDSTPTSDGATSLPGKCVQTFRHGSPIVVALLSDAYALVIFHRVPNNSAVRCFYSMSKT